MNMEDDKETFPLAKTDVTQNGGKSSFLRLRSNTCLKSPLYSYDALSFGMLRFNRAVLALLF